MIKILKLLGGDILISEIEEVGSELGEPDCKLTKPYLINFSDINNNITLESWMGNYTSDEFYMIHSDKIVTICEPKKSILEKYQSILK
jgi:hypothetical protein